MKIKIWAGVLGTAFLLAVCVPGYAQSNEDDLILEPELEVFGPGMGMGPGMGPGMGKGMGPGQGMGYGMQNQRGMAREMYLERIKKEDPKRYERIQKIKELAQAYRSTEDAGKKAQIEKELRPLLDAELKQQQADAKKRVADIEKRLARAKQILKQRDEHWNEVVEHNLKKITGQLDYLDFPPVGPPPKK